MDEHCLTDLLPLYYKRLFPADLFHRWLSYGKRPRGRAPFPHFRTL